MAHPFQRSLRQQTDLARQQADLAHLRAGRGARTQV